MKSIQRFNELDGTVVTRKKLQTIAQLARKENQRHIWQRIETMLKAHPGTNTFDIELDGKIEGLGTTTKQTAASKTVLHNKNTKKTLNKPNSGFSGLGLPFLYGMENIQDEDVLGLGKPVSQEEIYNYVTDLIINTIKEVGHLPWQKNWVGSGSGSEAKNYVTKKPYSGINWILLNFDVETDKDGNPYLVPIKFKQPYYLTFNQIKEAGATLKKGGSARRVLYYMTIFAFDDGTLKFRSADKEKVLDFIIENNLPEEKTKEIFIIPIVKYYNVYRADDCTGLKFPKPKPAKKVNPIEQAQAIIDNYPDHPKYIFKGSQPAYYPEADEIEMPKITAFNKEVEYYCTYFHEITHSTGHEKRLNRDLTGKYGTKNYAFEELIAELGAVFLCSEAGILFTTIENSAKYLNNWNKRLIDELENDNRFFLKASAQAQKAANHILDRENETKPTKKVTKAVKKKVAKTKSNDRELTKKSVKKIKGYSFLNVQQLALKGVRMELSNQERIILEDVFEMLQRMDEYDTSFLELHGFGKLKIFETGSVSFDLKNKFIKTNIGEALARQAVNHILDRSEGGDSTTRKQKNIEPEKPAEKYGYDEILKLKNNVLGQLDRSKEGHIARNFIEDLVQKAHKDLALRNTLGDWLSGKTKSLKLKELLEKAGYKETLAHYNAYTMLDSTIRNQKKGTPGKGVEKFDPKKALKETQNDYDKISKTITLAERKEARKLWNRTKGISWEDFLEDYAQKKQQLKLFGGLAAPHPYFKTAKDAKKYFLDWARKHLLGKSVYHEELGKRVHFNMKGIDHAISSKLTITKASLITQAKEMLENSKLIKTETDKKNRKEIKAVYRLLSTAQIENELQEVIITLREGENGTIYYDHKIEELKKLSSPSIGRQRPTVCGSKIASSAKAQSKGKKKNRKINQLGALVIDVSANQPTAVVKNEGLATAGQLVNMPVVKTEPQVSKNSQSKISKLKSMGFEIAANGPSEIIDTFVLPGAIGEFIQTIQPHKALILIKGTKHTSKSQVAMQIANAFGEKGDMVAYIDYEQGGLQSKDTQNSLKWNASEAGKQNIAVIGHLEEPFKQIQEFCEVCKVIVADSVTDLQITADQLNELRTNYPDVIWIFISQVKENGEMYGGNKMAHNPTCIIKCHPSHNPEKRYATLEKNRGNDLSLAYSIFEKRLINLDEFLQEKPQYPSNIVI